MKFIVGLTGQTGAGKTETGAIAEKLGFYVIDCDKVAKSVTSKSSNAISALIKAFGGGITDGNGNIDRKKLAKRAFADKDSTELLNKTVLPFISEQIKNIISSEKSDKILLDAPTLFESGINEICDFTLAVVADEKIRLKRIMNRDGISEREATARINAGKSIDFFLKNADKVIYNNGDIQTYKKEFEFVLGGITNVG